MRDGARFAVFYEYSRYEACTSQRGAEACREDLAQLEFDPEVVASLDDIQVEIISCLESNWDEDVCGAPDPEIVSRLRRPSECTSMGVLLGVADADALDDVVDVAIERAGCDLGNLRAFTLHDLDADGAPELEVDVIGRAWHLFPNSGEPVRYSMRQHQVFHLDGRAQSAPITYRWGYFIGDGGDSLQPPGRDPPPVQCVVRGCSITSTWSEARHRSCRLNSDVPAVLDDIEAPPG